MAATAVGVHEARDKVRASLESMSSLLLPRRHGQLPIYPIPDQEVVLVETPSELEKQIGVARRAVTGTYLDAHARVQAVVSRWIGVEQAVESAYPSCSATSSRPLTHNAYI